MKLSLLSALGASNIVSSDARRVTSSGQQLTPHVTGREECHWTSGEPNLPYNWDPSCVHGGPGCNADGHHAQCRFCGVSPFPDCNTPSPAPVPSPAPAPVPAPAPAPGTHSAEEYLTMVDAYLDNQPRNPNGLLQIYGPNSIGGGDCPECELEEPCPNFGVTPHCRYDVYDNALAAIYYTKRGNLASAKSILDGFIHLLYPPYGVTHAFGPEEGHPSGRHMTLIAASYSDLDAKAGDYGGHGVSDGAVDVGNNAWVGMAFARYAAATGEGCYGTAARDILHIIREHTGCNDAMRGFMGRLPPYTKHYRSVEHNIDMFAFARMLGAEEEKQSARTFVQHMFGQDDRYDQVYVVGTGDSRACDTHIGHEPVAVDGQLWQLAAGVDTNEAHISAALGFSLHEKDETAHGRARLQGLWETDVDLIGNHGVGQGETYYGFRFTNWGNGIQWENTASGLIAMVRYRALYGEHYGVTTKINQARDSLKRLLNVYNSVPASVLGGNIDAWHRVRHQATYPGGSDTGIGWTYLRYPHMASTVWAGFALMYQGADGDAIDDLANPYTAPTTAVPPAVENGACLPAEEAAPSASCSGNAGCAPLGLWGDCCPNGGGVYLGCCS